MKIHHVILAAAILVSANVFAQKKPAAKTTTKAETADDAISTDNIVPNGSFEDAEVKGLKATGQLTTFCKDWTTPNKTSADLFHKDSKGTKTGVPQNDYGYRDPVNDGNAYAGFRAYTKDPKKVRTYIQVKLNKKLEKDKRYCVRFNLSLAGCSKFGVNNVGAFFSDRKIQNQEDKALAFAPQVLEKTNKSITTNDGWETICATIIGSGKEEYLIIGGFGLEDDLKPVKVKKPAGSTALQGNEAYYYIDEIEVTEVEAASQCFCGKAEDRDPDLIYSRASAKSPDMKPEQVISNTAVYYAFLSSETSEMFAADLTAVLGILNSNPNLKIEITGHCDADEMDEAKMNPRYSDIGLKRAETIKKYFTDNGIAAGRITVVNKNNESPASTMPTPVSKAQNRRIELAVK
jgi:outer membrane protein OmpA-like peptidoglycan-associated protein